MTKRKKAEDLLLEKHGMYMTSEYIAWRNMISRCHSKTSRAYKNYGARGITVCPEWRASLVVFYKDMGARPSKDHSIDRINNNEGYSKDNCKWSTRAEQTINRRIPKKESGLPVGVRSYWRDPSRFTSIIKVQGKRYIIGTFSSAQVASLEYIKIYKEWYGKEPVC